MRRKRYSLLLPQDGDLFWSSRWEYMEDVYRVLAENLREEPVYETEPDWKREYLELRKVLGAQAREASELFGEYCRNFPRSVQLNPPVEKKLRKKFLEKKIRTDRILCTEKSGKKELVMGVHMQDGGYLTAREAAEIAGNVLRIPLRPAVDSCVVISSSDTVLKLEQRPLYDIRHGVAKCIRTGEIRSGDNYSFQKLPGGKLLMGLSDGMGSGPEAFEESAKVLDLIELFLQAELSPRTAIRMVQSLLFFAKGEERRPETLDLAVVDLEEGRMQMFKNGAPATFLCRDDSVEILRAEALPLGVLEEARPFEEHRRLKDGDLIVMVTDGVLEAMPGDQKEEAFAGFLKKLPVCHPKGTAEEAIRYVKECYGAKCKDDCMVLAAVIWKSRD